MAFKTYSFEDVIMTFADMGIGQEVVTGAGIGTISVTMANDVTAHDVASDGNVMVSKLLRKNGTIVIQIQQTSSLHKALIAWYNSLLVGKTSEWAKASINISSIHLGDKTSCTGVSPQKMSDRGYEAQGQLASWTLMAAEITHE